MVGGVDQLGSRAALRRPEHPGRDDLQHCRGQHVAHGQIAGPLAVEVRGVEARVVAPRGARAALRRCRGCAAIALRRRGGIDQRMMRMSPATSTGVQLMGGRDSRSRLCARLKDRPPCCRHRLLSRTSNPPDGARTAQAFRPRCEPRIMCFRHADPIQAASGPISFSVRSTRISGCRLSRRGRAE